MIANWKDRPTTSPTSQNDSGEKRPPRKRLSLRSKLAFTTVCLTLIVVLAEVGFRAYLSAFGPPQAVFVVPPAVGKFDPQLGWVNKPGATATSRATGRAVEYRINSNGLRDDETAYQKPPGTFRIVLLGDSRTFGFGVPIERHFSSLLETRTRNVEVVNLGVSGFGLGQELLYLQSEGFRYQPDLVIPYVAHFSKHRHMHTRRFGKEKPRFLLRGDQLVLDNSPVPSPTLLTTLAPYSKILDTIRIRLVIREATRTRDQDKKNKESAEFQEKMSRLAARIVQEMHAECRKREVAFGLVTHLGKLHTFCRKRNIPSIDVSRALADPGLTLGRNLGHINDRGNAILAYEFIRFIRSENLAPVEHVNQISGFD